MMVLGGLSHQANAYRALVHQVVIFLNLCTICVDICIHGLNCSVCVYMHT